METVEIPREICEYIQTQAQQEEKERVIKSIKEWLKDNIYEKEFREFYEYLGDYYYDNYDLCVTRHNTEKEFWKAFNKFVKTLQNN